MQSKERSFALSSLLRTFTENEFSGKLINEYCAKLPKREQHSFFTAVFLGTLDNIILLDEIIKYASTRKLKDINIVVKNILRLSLYQIYFLDRVPNAAIVSTAHILCEEKGQHRAKPFVNGILRYIIRNKDRILRGIYKNKSPIEQMNLKYSMPAWITDYLLNSVDIDSIENIYKNFSKNHFLTLRVSCKITMNEALELLGEFNPLQIGDLPMVRLGVNTGIQNLPGFNKGYFYVQDISSVEAVLETHIKKDDFIMDLCAAPGGKGLFAAELAETGFVSMRDISGKKTNIVRENAKVLNIENIEIKEYDAREIDKEYVGRADIVICDLPCSGLGTIGNKPELKYRVKREDIDELAKLQRRILETAILYLKPKGKILYSTCTMGEVENIENVRWFLHEYRDFKLIHYKDIYPDGLGGDGFFYAVLAKGEYSA